MRREENKLDTTEWFIALIICSTCSGTSMTIIRSSRLYVCVLLPPMVCSAWLLVVGGQEQGSKLSRKRDVARRSRATSVFVDA